MSSCLQLALELLDCLISLFGGKARTVVSVVLVMGRGLNGAGSIGVEVQIYQDLQDSV